MVNMKAFPDHGWRFGIPKAFYIIIDDTDFIDKLGKNSLIYLFTRPGGRPRTMTSKIITRIRTSEDGKGLK